jgi:zinc transport system substrate-binding protein
LQCDSTYNVLNTKFESLKGESFIVYHPIWTYLANDLGLTQISIEHNGKEATADKLKMIIDFAKANNIHTLFVQQEFSDAQAKTIANEINGKVIPLNPLAYDWFSIMKTFEEAFIEQFN